MTEAHASGSAPSNSAKRAGASCAAMRACSYSCVFAFIAVLMRLQDLVGNAWYTRSLPLLGFWLILLIPQWYMVALTLNYFDQRLYLRKKSHNQRALSAP